LIKLQSKHILSIDTDLTPNNEKYAGLDHREIKAMFGGVHPSTVSKASVHFEAELARDRRLSRLVKHALSNARA
jgi:hypothetical protein